MQTDTSLQDTVVEEALCPFRIQIALFFHAYPDNIRLLDKVVSECFY